MEDLKSRRAKLLTDAADCELIANLAVEPSKREMFDQLTKSLRRLADDLDAEIARREGTEAAREGSPPATISFIGRSL